MKRFVWLLAIASFLCPRVPPASARSPREGPALASLGQSGQGLEISVLGLRRQKTWGFSDGKPDPSSFLKAEALLQSQDDGLIVTKYEGTIEPDRLKLVSSQGTKSWPEEFEFVRVEGNPSAHPSGLRFDGLYRLPVKLKDNPAAYYTYLRFLEDGTVRVLTTDLQPGNAWNLLSGGRAFPYSIEVSKIKFAQVFGAAPARTQQQPLFTADSGYDIVVLLLKVKTLEPQAGLDFGRLWVEDEQGKAYNCPLKSSDICGEGVKGSEGTCGVPFTVPEGTRLNKLRYGEISIDLQHLEKKR